jgi:hypothetical protein
VPDGLSDLPEGTAPAPLALRHFPDRLHAYVWRNWPLVPVDRLARVVGARSSDFVSIAQSMGLGKPPRISRDQLARSYITIIKRNWHLLPYDQLLALLGWTPPQLAYTLREDDFLFVKLGSLKPRCEPLRYQAPTPAITQRAQAIARTLRAELGPEANQSQVPLFDFVRELSQPPARSVRPSAATGLRFCYSYFALYGDPLLDTQADSYPDGYLARLAQAGVNGIWLQAVLYKLAPFPWAPGLSAQWQLRLQNLRRLVQRAGRYGIRVFLYLNEPRAMPLRFFNEHPQLKGVVEGDHAALCTSTPEVQRYLIEAVASICWAVPALGGFFTISASENLSNCWSHGGGAGCPRCGARSPAEVIAMTNGLFQQGINLSGLPVQLIVWDWGWNDAWAPEAIRRLPASVHLMSVSEWQLPIERGGVRSTVGEYSISAVGPGPRAQRHWQLARERGLAVLAKVQAGNTWELSSVPYIPAVQNVAQHARNLRDAGIRDLMLGWTLGGYPSPNLEVVAETFTGGSVDEVLQRVAVRRFGEALAPAVVAAWRAFSTAFSEFPYDGGLLYSGPQQLGPANLLWPAPTGYHASMVGFPYDDLDAWRSIYPPDIFIAQFNRVADGFAAALDQLRQSGAQAGKQLTPTQRSAFAAECRVAETVSIHCRSSANQARFVLARRALAAAGPDSDKAPYVSELRAVIGSELALARRMYAIQSQDSRIGFEASNQYYFVPIDLAEKILNCRDLLDHWLPGSP